MAKEGQRRVKGGSPLLYKHQPDDMDHNHSEGENSDNMDNTYDDNMQDNDDMASNASEQSVYYDFPPTRSGEATPRATATHFVQANPLSGSSTPVQFSEPVDSRFELSTERPYPSTSASAQEAHGTYTFSYAFQKTLPQRPSKIGYASYVNMDLDLVENPWSNNYAVLGKRSDRDNGGVARVS